MPNTSDFWLGDRFVRPSLGEIQLGPERVHIEPRSMEVLLALVERAPDVVPKQELIDAVWGGEFVTDDVLTHAIWDLRRALGDNASDPEFIQTIPKRGYRLIAPVKPVTAPRRRASDRQPAAEGEPTDSAESQPARPRGGSPRVAIWLTVLVGAVAAAALWLGSGFKTEDTPPPLPPAATVLVLLPTVAPEELSERARTLDRRLETSLDGLKRARLRPATTCRAAPGADRTFCLTPELTTMSETAEAYVRVRDATTDRQLYATPPRALDGSALLAAFCRETAGLLGAFLEVVEDERFLDPDYEPWIDTRKHDIRAIRDFLYGAEYVTRDEIGGRHPLDNAIERDPLFIAPRVYRTPSLMREGDDETVAAHRLALEDLYPEGSAFEKAMIRWTIALMDGDTAEQIIKLEGARRQHPENRPVRINLAWTYFGLGEYDNSWAEAVQLVEEGWNYPPLYPLAALAALHRGELADARRVLERAAELDPIDTNGLALLWLLAIFDVEVAQASRFERLYRQAKQDRPADQINVAELEFAARHLADAAENEGRHAIAKQLRESVF